MQNPSAGKNLVHLRKRVLACPKCHEQEGAVGSKAEGRVGGIRLGGREDTKTLTLQ